MTLKMRVLIVDDQPRARQSMKALLGAWYQVEEVFEAANGAEAVTLAEEFQPDLILMDARMPKMNGMDAIRRIKAKWQPVKIIAFSMYTDFKAEALAAGADAFVNKSDSLEILRETLDDVMGDWKKIE
jgi:DNA-binding NarL/FixJ family response regulator